jgi:ABC-type glycerol-3-phosphate transport system permease component
MMRSKKRNSFVAVLCIVIIIAYASVIFIPYVHDCVGADCSVCALIETSRNTMIGLALAATVHQLPNIVFTILSSYKSIPSGNNGTPVALKVKLSD